MVCTIPVVTPHPYDVMLNDIEVLAQWDSLYYNICKVYMAGLTVK